MRRAQTRERYVIAMAAHSSQSRRADPSRGGASSFDLLAVPVLGAALKRPLLRTTLRWAMLIVALIMVVHGFVGPSFAPDNLATVVTWTHFRGALVLVLLVAGNFFCMACPFVALRDGLRRLVTPRLQWPRALRNKWLACALFISVLFVYEWLDLWSAPVWTAGLILAFMVAATVIDTTFKGASFCKHVCPIGQFNFIASSLSPLEVKVRSPAVCAGCTTAACINGTPAAHGAVSQRGCELVLFQPAKRGNFDCTFCLDCVYACPHDNIGITTRIPAEELWDPRRRSGLGRLTQRADVSVLVLLFTFGALLNAFAMVSPVYAVQAWLGQLLGWKQEGSVLLALFVLMLVVEPALVLGAAAYLTRRALGTRERLIAVLVRYSFALAPLGFGIWLAHYSFHFFTGLGTIWPAAWHALVAFGLPMSESAPEAFTGLAPGNVLPLQVGFVVLGTLGSITAAYRIAQRDNARRVAAAFAPWGVVCLLLGICGVWLMFQPMEMRGMMFAG